MFTTRHTAAGMELLHWLLWIVAAIALLLALATALAADPMGPQLLPGNVRAPAGPLARPFFPEDPPLPPHVAMATAAKLEMIFQHQQGGCYAEALADWERTRLPTETSVWREIGMAAAWVALEDFPQALRRLELAEQIAPHHPLAAYYRGLVWMRQAEKLARSNGEPQAIVVHTAEERAVLELMAIADLQEAVERAELIDRAEPLVLVRPFEKGPQVRDLLAALRAEHFADDAQLHLFRLHLGRQEFTDAKEHLEAAVKSGVAGTGDMHLLAAAMLDAGETAGAAGVMHEVVQRDYPAVLQFCVRMQKWLTEKPAH